MSAICLPWVGPIGVHWSRSRAQVAGRGLTGHRVRISHRYHRKGHGVCVGRSGIGASDAHATWVRQVCFKVSVSGGGDLCRGHSLGGTGPPYTLRPVLKSRQLYGGAGRHGHRVLAKGECGAPAIGVAWFAHGPALL